MTFKGRAKIAFLVWAPSSPRAEGLASSLDATLVQLSYKFKRKIYSPFKYPILFYKSLTILRRLQPQIIICQDPPPFCVLSAITYCYFSRSQAKLVIDAHTAAFHRPWSRLKNLHKRVLRRANIVIVTSDRLRELILNNYDIDCLVLQDKIPCIERTAGSSNIFIANFQSDRKSSRASDQGRTNSRNTKVESEEFDENKSSFKAVVICSFAPDEPIVEVVDAAKILPEVTFYLTGDNSQAKWLNKESASSNVIFTGYLNKEDYFSLLREADTIVVLTKRDNTMLSGAYEAVALCKPLITSNWPVLKNYFDRGTIHVNNDSEEIKNAIRTVMIKGSQLEKEIKQLKEIRTKEWNNQFINFKALLSDNAKSL